MMWNQSRILWIWTTTSRDRLILQKCKPNRWQGNNTAHRNIFNLFRFVSPVWCGWFEALPEVYNPKRAESCLARWTHSNSMIRHASQRIKLYRAVSNVTKGIIMYHQPKFGISQGQGKYLWLWRILDFLNVLCKIQQLGNRTLPRARPEPWMANVSRLRQAFKTSIRTYRKSYIWNPEQIISLPLRYAIHNLKSTLWYPTPHRKLPLFRCLLYSSDSSSSTKAL